MYIGNTDFWGKKNLISSFIVDYLDNNPEHSGTSIFERGELISKTEILENEKDGVVVFQLDKQIFEDISMSYEVLSAELKNDAIINKNVNFVVKDERKAYFIQNMYHYTEGGKTYLEELKWSCRQKCRHDLKPRRHFLRTRNNFFQRFSINIHIKNCRNGNPKTRHNDTFYPIAKGYFFQQLILLPFFGQDILLNRFFSWIDNPIFFNAMCGIIFKFYTRVASRRSF